VRVVGSRRTQGVRTFGPDEGSANRTAFGLYGAEQSDQPERAQLNWSIPLVPSCAPGYPRRSTPSLSESTKPAIVG
jgi:hypothetical protein